MERNEMKWYELTADGTRNKEFYNKAAVIEKGGVKFLVSYNTIIASVTQSGRFRKHWDGWSATSAKHLTAFSSQFCGSGGYMGKNGWDEMKTEKVTADIYVPYRNFKTTLF